MLYQPASSHRNFEYHCSHTNTPILVRPINYQLRANFLISLLAPAHRSYRIEEGRTNMLSCVVETLRKMLSPQSSMELARASTASGFGQRRRPAEGLAGDQRNDGKSSAMVRSGVQRNRIPAIGGRNEYRSFGDRIQLHR